MSVQTHVRPVQEIDYPESDGKPMGESDVHRREMAQMIDMLEMFFEDDELVYVSGNLMFYYEEGEPGEVVAPDVFVVKGIPKRLRTSYKLWAEGHIPCTVIEITSKSTKLEDKGNKRVVFGSIGILEYFMFDPIGDYLKPALQGFKLNGDDYLAMLPAPDGSLVSEQLGLRLKREGTFLQLFDLKTGRRLLRSREIEAARKAEETARKAEERARRKAEQQARKAEQQARKAEQQAQAEIVARQQAEQQAQAEIVARQQAEAEVARLRAALAQLRGDAHE